LEGVSFGLRDGFELMKAAGLADITQVRVTGGGARSPFWLQILANIIGVSLVTVSSEEGAAFGAALLAAVGCGSFDSVESACRNIIHITSRNQPDDKQDIYETLYPTYRGLYPALSRTFWGIREAK
jgi:xylulokinase